MHNCINNTADNSAVLYSILFSLKLITHLYKLNSNENNYVNFSPTIIYLKFVFIKLIIISQID